MFELKHGRKPLVRDIPGSRRRCKAFVGFVFFSFSVPLLLPGCLFLPGREKLAQLEAERGSPYATTVFRKDPGPGERPLDELRGTLEHWTGPDPRGEPRWKGVLVPDPEGLYAGILERMAQGAQAFTLVAYRYDARGLDDLTLVDYLDEKGARLGSDHPAFPEPKEPGPAAFPVAGFYNLEWWEIPQMLLLDLPVYLVLGTKELAGEVVKSPLSFLEAGWLGPSVEGRTPISPVNFKYAFGAFAEDWRNGFSGLLWRLRVRSRHTPLDLGRELLAAVPVVGPIFDYRSPPEDAAPPATTALIVLSHGIGAGGEDEQYLAAWKQGVEEARPGTTVAVAPYRYGAGVDVLWSLLNLSQGTGIDLAERIVFDEGIGPGDSVEILGFSAGAQRAVAATRALRCGGITVRRIAGVAGPVGMSSCALESWQLVGESPFEDPVVLSARLWALLFLPFSSNVAVSTVPGAGGHHLPYLPHPATRAPSRGYAARLETLLKG